MAHKFNIGEKVVTNGANPKDNSKMLLPKQVGIVVGYDTDGKNMVLMDNDKEPMFISDHELDKSSL